jgi:7-cyano-7-deazaguanine synthase in queuosine biosynthesis
LTDEKPLQRHLVMWSGGLDSTVLLHKLAKKHGTAAEPVRTLSVDHPQIHNAQIRMQRAARVKFLAFAKEKGLHVQDTEIEMRSSGAWMGDAAGHVQPALWLGVAGAYAEKNQTLHFGYIRGDDIWHYRHNFTTALHHTAILKGVHETALVEFDLEWESKADVLKYARGEGFPEGSWWTCENPRREADVVVACRTCHPCSTLAWAEFELAEKPATGKS